MCITDDPKLRVFFITVLNFYFWVLLKNMLFAFVLPYFLAETIYCFFEINSTITDHSSGFLSSYVSIWSLSPYWLTSPTFTHHTERDSSYTGDFQRHFQLCLYYLMPSICCLGDSLFLLMRYWIPSSNLWTASKRLCALSCTWWLLFPCVT